MKNLIRKILKEEIDDLSWIDDVPSTIPIDHIPKIGSRMICIPGFNNHTNYDIPNVDPKYGGSGYVEGKVFIVDFVFRSDSGGRNVVFPENSNGIYVDALNYYNE